MKVWNQALYPSTQRTHATVRTLGNRTATEGCDVIFTIQPIHMLMRQTLRNTNRRHHLSGADKKTKNRERGTSLSACMRARARVRE